MATPHDLRQSERVCPRLEVTVTTADSRRLDGQLRDVSLTGAFVQCAEPLPKGARCRIAVPLADRPEFSIQAAALVVRHETDGIAVEFLELIGVNSLHHLRNLLLYNAPDAGRMQQELDSHFGMPSPGIVAPAPPGLHSPTLLFAPTAMPCSLQDLTVLVGNVWGAMLRLPVHLTNVCAPASEGADFLTGRVPVAGVWRGEVFLTCPSTLAENAAARLFATEGPPTAEQVRDTVGELTNILAGNLKGQLPGPSELGLPEVVSGACKVGGRGSPGIEADFACEDSVFRVTVLQATPRSNVL